MIKQNRELMVKEWIHGKVKKSSLHQKSLKELYFCYRLWCGDNESIPVSKRKLSSELKKYFNEDIGLGNILVLNRSGILFQGLNVHNNKGD